MADSGASPVTAAAANVKMPSIMSMKGCAIQKIAANNEIRTRKKTGKPK